MLGSAVGKVGGKKGFMKFLAVGIVVSVILALNLPARLGLAGAVASIAVLAVGGLVIRKYSGFAGVSMLIAAGLVAGQAFVTPKIGALGQSNANAPAALTYTQLNDPIKRAFLS